MAKPKRKKKKKKTRGRQRSYRGWRRKPSIGSQLDDMLASVAEFHESYEEFEALPGQVDELSHEVAQIDVDKGKTVALEARIARVERRLDELLALAKAFRSKK